MVIFFGKNYIVSHSNFNEKYFAHPDTLKIAGEQAIKRLIVIDK